MSRAPAPSSLLTVRIAPSLARALDREARRRRGTRSEVARSLLEAGLRAAPSAPDPAEEARRQSLLVSGRRSEREVGEWLTEAADLRGWK